MPKMSLSLSTLTDMSAYESLSTELSSINVNNTIANRVTNPSRVFTLRIAQAMRTSLTIEPTESKNQNELSHKILTAMGCSLITSGPKTQKKYSLIVDQHDTETIDNPNKFDINNLATLSPGTISIESIFSNEQDSLFQLDSALPSRYQEQSSVIVAELQTGTPPVNVCNVVEKALNLSLNTEGVDAVRGLQAL